MKNTNPKSIKPLISLLLYLIALVVGFCVDIDSVILSKIDWVMLQKEKIKEQNPDKPWTNFNFRQQFPRRNE